MYCNSIQALELRLKENKKNNKLLDQYIDKKQSCKEDCEREIVGWEKQRRFEAE